MLDLAPQQRVLHLVAMQPEAFDAFFKSLKPQQRNALMQDLSPDLKEVVGDLENPQRLVNEEIIAQRLTRDIYSNAQLQEVMTDFWLNHFNVFLHKNEATPYYLVSFERDVIRPRALGKFEDLLEATAHSPAMMIYLDNASSIGPDSMAAERAERRPNNNKKKREGLNENYARELMELHTLGVNGGYTQADVTQVARILTGWSVERPERGGGFQFDPNRHEPGTKIVMGEKFKDHGEAGRTRTAAHAGDTAGDGAVHLAQAGGALCERRSAAGAGGSHGEDVPEQRWRHCGGAQHAVSFAGVLGRERVSRQGEDSDRVCCFRGAGRQRGHREHAAAGQCGARDGHAALWLRDAEWIQLDGGSRG